MTQFAQFKRECLRRQKEFGLLDWQITFGHEPRKRDSDESMSTIYYNYSARIAKLVWRHQGQRGMSVADIAKHEMIHLLFADMVCVIAARGSDEHADSMREEHKVIEKLMRLVR